MTSSLKKGRGHSKHPVVRYRNIVAALRQRILDGRVPPGRRLPTHVDLEKEFRTTALTMQRALSVLRQEGFIRSDKRRGMFVTEKPPHRFHYALAFSSKEDQCLSQFYVALRNEAVRFESAGRRFSIFYEISEHTDTEDYQRLLGFVRSHRLAGLIFASAPFLVEGSSLLDEPHVPRVAVASESDRADIPVVYPDSAAFVPKALDYLARRGRKRVAAMLASTDWRHDARVEQLLQGAAKRRMRCRPAWIQGVDSHATLWASHAAQLLLHVKDRPDALIILDDNIVEHATAGIAASELRVPKDIEIIAHTNFPWPTPSAVPVRRLGYDVRQLLELCVERVDALRRGEQPRAKTWLPALFEDELTSMRDTSQRHVAEESISGGT